jgi:APA family basic amino acid/polyamine antiporter
VFFKQVATLHPRSHVPAVAIVLQGALAIIIAMSGRYEQILNYVVSVDSIFFGLTAACLFALRKGSASDSSGYARRVNPIVILLFIIAEWLVAASAIYKDPRNSLIGVAILVAGIPVYYFWKVRGKRE